MNKLKMFKNCQSGNLTNAKWLEERIVNIPSSVNLSQPQPPPKAFGAQP